MEFPLNVLYNLGRSCRREGKDGALREEFADTSYLQVGGTEIVAPLTDAVRLIHRDEAHLHALQLIQEQLAGKTFRRNVEEFVGSEDAVLQNGQNLVVRHAAINVGSLDVAPFESLDLIPHERYERRENDADALHGKCRNLECDALAATCRHETQGVAPGADALYDL